MPLDLAKKTQNRMRKIAKKQISFGVVKEFLMFENWPQLIEGAVEGMELVEERDWGLPWPEFDSEGDESGYPDCNLRIFEYNILTMPCNREYSEELKRLLALEESRKKVKRLLASRVRYIKLMVRKLFKIKTEKMSRSGHNYYTRLVAMVIGNFGFNSVYPLEIRISIFIIAFTFAFVLH